jgi:hypothetical protein
LVRSLELVELVDAENSPIDGLVSVHKLASAASPHERAILSQAATFEDVDYVFFRRFNDAEGRNARSSQVAAYVVDNSQQRLAEDELARLHHKLWLHGVAPLVYVAWPTRIDILSCARKPAFWDADNGVDEYRYAVRIEAPSEKVLPLEGGRKAIKTAAAIADAFTRLRRRFSAYRLEPSTHRRFWLHYSSTK